ncbi:sulfatase family protein [Neolewinella sp.]|uniref:sulfatase family protein n=1 Tax=Neolewinella sp. TaxID=2993543 RepID=UPI003B522CDA
MRNYPLLSLLALLLCTCGPAQEDEELTASQGVTAEGAPNIILILADDLGYGDAGVYNPESVIPTPNIDRLASQGMRFTDAHSTSAVCTPTRYGIVTGQYSWRGPLKQGVTWSYDTLIINTAQSTVASILDDRGYRTACVGKWHLGLGWEMDGDEARFDRPLTAGPNDLGFDSFYGITASLDIPPYLYVRDHRVVMQPTDSTQGTATGYFDDYWRPGPVSPDFDHHQTLNHLTTEAERVIREGATGRAPFFLYFPLTGPHLPWIPREEFRGKSGAGNYGDMVVEVDDVLGRITRLVDSLGIAENTLIVFTSDNGSQLSTELMAEYNHRSNGPYRGRKGDIYEGGHRVPFIVRWPARVAAGTTSDALVSTTDFYATFAEITEQDREPPGEIKDSHSFLPILAGDAAAQPRQSMIYHSAKGLFALRDGRQVLVAGRGSGGFLEVADTLLTDPPYQLYDLGKDTSEAVNLAEEQAGRVEELRGRLTELRKGSE